MAKGKNDKILNREMGDGASGSVKRDMGHDAGKEGYTRYDFGGNEDPNYRIEDGYKMKDESPARSEDSNIHEIAHHTVTGELYSGDPEGHGHKNKVAAAYNAGPFDTGGHEHKGGGTNAEEG
jgi:hypothetical protein